MSAFFHTFPNSKTYLDRLHKKRQEKKDQQAQFEALETKKIRPRCQQLYFGCDCCAPKWFFLDRKQEADSVPSVFVEYKGQEFKVAVTCSRIKDIMEEVLPLIGESIENPKLFLGDERLCPYGEFFQRKEWFFLFPRLRGGGYLNQHIQCLTKEEQIQIVEIHGNKEIYHVIPELWSEVNVAELPVRSRYHFVLPNPYPPHVQNALSKYTGDDFFALNLRLNLLNCVIDRPLFSALMEVALGSFQLNLPDQVYRYTHLSDEEMDFYAANVGQKFLYKQFLSTSADIKSTKHFGPHCLVIELKRGQRNGAFYIGNDSQYPTEKEVLLCAYSLYTISSVSNQVITLIYTDYYEYHSK